MPLQELENISALIDEFAQRKLSKPKFVEKLLREEANQDWHFTLDGNRTYGYRLQIRNETTKTVVVFDKNSHAYTTISSPLIEDQVGIKPLIQSDRTVVGISGPARKPIDRKYVEEQLQDIFSSYSPEHTYILTGGYPGGLPLKALEVATRMGFEVIAVVPQVIFLPSFFNYVQRFNSIIQVGKDWGDETRTFARSIDVLYVFGGGGPWTNLEEQQARDLGKEVHNVLLPQREKHS